MNVTPRPKGFKFFTNSLLTHHHTRIVCIGVYLCVSPRALSYTGAGAPAKRRMVLWGTGCSRVRQARSKAIMVRHNSPFPREPGLHLTSILRSIWLKGDDADKQQQQHCCAFSICWISLCRGDFRAPDLVVIYNSLHFSIHCILLLQ